MAVPGSQDDGEGDAVTAFKHSSSSSSLENGTDNNAPIKYDDEDFCRICRSPGDAENPLRYPCACSGSIKFVHDDCLLRWLIHSNISNARFRVCKHAFLFSPVYAENAPARLPFQEFVVGLAMIACLVLRFFLHLSFVLSFWFLGLPLLTFWIWRLAFVRSFGEVQRLFSSHTSTTVILTDCLCGYLLCASIVFIFLGAVYLKVYFSHLREIGGQDADREDGGRNGAHAAITPPRQANRNFAGDGYGEDEGGAQGIAGAALIIRRNEENVAARGEMQAGHLEAQVEQMFGGLDDANGVEDVPFDEPVEMQRAIFHMVENAPIVVEIMLFLGVVIFVPFSLGRIVLHCVSWLLSSATCPLLSSVNLLTESALSLVNVAFKNVLTAVANLTSYKGNALLGQITEILKANATGPCEVSKNLSTPLSADIIKGASVGTSQLYDVTTLAVGYMFIFSLVFLYLGIVALIRYAKNEPLTMGSFYSIAAITTTITPLFRQFVSAMRHLMTMIKVAFLLAIDFGYFPLMCGWWLDICTTRMFAKSIAQRVEFFSVSPLASSLVNWVLGVMYIVLIEIFVSLLRGVLRNGVLHFLGDPDDPNYNPFRDLIYYPLYKHARMILLDVAVYGSLVVMLVFLPVKLAIRMAPSIFPLDISSSDQYTEFLTGTLLFQICIPFAIQHFKLQTIESVLCYWFTIVGWALGLSDFLLPRPEDIDGQEIGNGELAGQDRLHAQIGGQDQALGEHVVPGDLNKGRYRFLLCIVLLLLLAWMTLLIVNSALIVIPIALGQAFLSAIPLLPITHGNKCNDLHAFVIGSFVIWTALAGARHSIEHIKTTRATLLLGQIWKWCGIVLQSSALLLIWFFVIPLLIGLLFELLAIVPMRVPVNESPVFHLYQDWALGLIFLKIWTRLVMMDRMVPLVDVSWRIKFERVREDGFSGLQCFWVLREIILPILMKLLTALCVPYVLARGVFPVFGCALVVDSAVYRFAWLGCLWFRLWCFFVKRLRVWLSNLHNSIRDGRYLIGHMLLNYGEDSREGQNEARDSSSGAQNSNT